jgi:hypothetical protein
MSVYKEESAVIESSRQIIPKLEAAQKNLGEAWKKLSRNINAARNYQQLKGSGHNAMRTEYAQLRTADAQLKEVARHADLALKEMKGALNPLRGVEKLANDVVKKLEGIKMPNGGAFSAGERNLFAYARNVESASRLNIQRCEAIRKHVESARKNLPKVVFGFGTDESFRYAQTVSDELGQADKWCVAASKSLGDIEHTVRSMIELEVNIILQEKKAGLSRSI